MRAQDRAGGANGDVERRVGRLARHGRRVAVEEHGDLVARCVLELLHHQVPAARRRRPVHAAQRFALLVVANAVQLEPGWAPEQQTAPVVQSRSPLREEPVELDEPRVDDERLRLLDLELAAREAEGILDREADRLEAVAPARQRPQLVAAGVAPPAHRVQLDRPLAEAAQVLARDERRRRQLARPLDDEIEADVLALDDVTPAAVPVDLGRARRQAHPGDGTGDGEDEPRRDRIERPGAEHPGDDVDGEPEGEDRAAAAGHTGTGVCSSASAISSSPPSPAERASGARIRRWASTGRATVLTSSGTR